VKTRLLRLIAVFWLAGIAYYLITDIYAVVIMQSLPRNAAVRIVAALWIECAAMLLIFRRAAGWWLVVAFLWLALGGQISGLLAQPNPTLSVRSAEPFAWILGWLLVLMWLRSNIGGRSGVVRATQSHG